MFSYFFLTFAMLVIPIFQELSLGTRSIRFGVFFRVFLLIKAFVFLKSTTQVFVEREFCKADMLSCHRVRHRKFAVSKILHERIKTT